MDAKMKEDVYEVPFSMIEMKECEAYAPLPNRSQNTWTHANQLVFSVDFNLYNAILLCSGLCFFYMATSYEMVL